MPTAMPPTVPSPFCRPSSSFFFSHHCSASSKRHQVPNGDLLPVVSLSLSLSLSISLSLPLSLSPSLTIVCQRARGVSLDGGSQVEARRADARVGPFAIVDARSDGAGVGEGGTTGVNCSACECMEAIMMMLNANPYNPTIC